MNQNPFLYDPANFGRITRSRARLEAAAKAAEKPSVNLTITTQDGRAFPIKSKNASHTIWDIKQWLFDKQIVDIPAASQTITYNNQPYEDSQLLKDISPEAYSQLRVGRDKSKPMQMDEVVKYNGVDRVSEYPRRMRAVKADSPPSITEEKTAHKTRNKPPSAPRDKNSDETMSNADDEEMTDIDVGVAGVPNLQGPTFAQMIASQQKDSEGKKMGDGTVAATSPQPDSSGNTDKMALSSDPDNQ